MITRYNVNFTDHMIEVAPDGRFVKYTDHEQAEMLVDVRVEENVSERIKAEREELKAKNDLAALLTSENEQLSRELQELRDYTDKKLSFQAHLILSAKDRLNLLGHSPTCDSRYKATTAEGQTVDGRCSCGLDEWMGEIGLKNG